MPARETRVVYKAIADFSALSRSAKTAKKDLADIRKEENLLNTDAVDGANKSNAARSRAVKFIQAAAAETAKFTAEEAKYVAAAVRHAKAVDSLTAAQEKLASAQAKVATGSNPNENAQYVAAAIRYSKALDAQTASTEKLNAAEKNLSSASRNRLGIADSIGQIGHFSEKTEEASTSTRRFGDSFRRLLGDMRGGNRVFGNVNDGLSGIHKGLRKIGNYRPRIMPPFIALVPIIGGIIGAINPLVGLLGAAGAAAFGFGSSLASLAGTALALPGILGAVAAGVSSVIGAFGGVGTVFTALKAANRQAANGGVASGPTPAERARSIQRANEDIGDAQVDLARTYEDAAQDIVDAERRVARANKEAQRAQEGITKAREEALETLQDLRKEVSRAGLDEERALANLREAQEEYWNVMADPGSTLGDKMDASASVKEAEADLADVREQNIQNSKDLAEAEKKGIEGSDRVVDAREGLTDALYEQQDAYKDLARAQEDEPRKIRDAMRSLEDAQTSLQDAINGSNSASGQKSGFDEVRAAMDKLSPSARRVVQAIMDMEPAWRRMRLSVQEAFFSRIVNDMDEVASFIPVLGRIWERAAASMGRTTHNAIQELNTQQWRRDLDEFGESSGIILDDMGDGAINLGNALRDLVISARPFTEWLVDSLRIGTENFKNLVAEGRRTGSIANYLNKVSGRLEQWWRIVKNVGLTLFNYGAASESFGRWLTDGLERTTEAWLAASEAAREPIAPMPGQQVSPYTIQRSPFQQWLEDIKPILSLVKEIGANIAGWFADVSTDPENMETIVSLLETIRDDLGPSLASLLETLGDSGIADGLLRALSSIFDAIDILMANGGSDAFVAFYDVIDAVFTSIADFVKTPGVKDVLGFVADELGTIAAIVFVGKFTGLTALLGALTRFGRGRGMGALKSLGGFLKNPAVLALAAIAGGSALQEASSAPGTKPGGEGAAGRVLGQVGTNIGTGAAAGAVVGGPIGAAVGALGGLVASPFLINQKDIDRFNDDTNGMFDDFAKNTVGMVDDFNKNTNGMFDDFWNGDSWIADVRRNVNKFFTELPDNVEKWAGDVWKNVQTADEWLGDRWTELENWVRLLPETFPKWAGDVWAGFVGPDTWLGKRWTQFENWVHLLPYTFPKWAGDVWAGFVGPDTWLGKRWTQFENWVRLLPSTFPRWAGDVWAGLVGPDSWLGQRWTQFQNWVGLLPSNFPRWAAGLWDGMAGPGSWLDGMLKTIQQWIRDLPGRILNPFGDASRSWTGAGGGGGGFGSSQSPGGAALNRVRSVLSGSGTQVTSTYRTPAQNRAVGGVPNSYHTDKNNPAVDLAGSIPAMDRMYVRLKAMGGWRQLLYRVAGHYDHIHVANKGGLIDPQYLADGGSVQRAGSRKVDRESDFWKPRGKDTVPAMLTPNEFVLREKIVKSIGAGNLSKLNSGMMSFQELLQESMRNAGGSPKSKNLRSGVSYFDGGGLVGDWNDNLASATRVRPSDFIGGSTTTVDNGTTVHVTVNNPKPEPVSDSLPRSIRKAAYIGGARQ